MYNICSIYYIPLAEGPDLIRPDLYQGSGSLEDDDDGDDDGDADDDGNDEDDEDDGDNDDDGDDDDEDDDDEDDDNDVDDVDDDGADAGECVALLTGVGWERRSSLN